MIKLDPAKTALDVIVDKTTPNSFVGTNLESLLKAGGVDTVVWAGMMTWMCVDTSVRAAKDLGFVNLLAHDACAAGWLKGPHGVVTLGFHHATLVSTRALVGY